MTARRLRDLRSKPGSGQLGLVLRNDRGEVGGVPVDFVRRVRASMAARPGLPIFQVLISGDRPSEGLWLDHRAIRRSLRCRRFPRSGALTARIGGYSYA